MLVYKTTTRENVKMAVTDGLIRIGTLGYYKRHKEEVRRDDDEGLASYTLRSNTDDLILNAERATELLKRSGLPVSLAPGWKIVIKKGSGGLKSQDEFNSCIFSCSYSSEAIPEINNNFGDAMYSVSDPVKFAKLVGDHLLKNEIVKYIADNEKIPNKYFCYHGIVQYSKKGIEVNNVDDIPIYDKKIKLEDLFTKDFKYHDEKEYRFVWFFGYTNDSALVSLSRKPEYFDVLLPEIKQLFKLL